MFKVYCCLFSKSKDPATVTCPSPVEGIENGDVSSMGTNLIPTLLLLYVNTTKFRGLFSAIFTISFSDSDGIQVGLIDSPILII